MAIFQSMKLISLTLLYSLSTSHAKPILSRDANSTTIAFQLTAAHSGPDGINIHLSPLVANGGAFWIESSAKDTSTYCPLKNRTLCPPGKLTEFLGRPGLGEIALNTAVPGGQQVHVAPNGALSFTHAHSAFIPTGSSYGPFNITLNSNPARASQFRYAGPGASVSGDDFYACSEGGKEHGPYQVFVNIEGLGDGDVLGGCLGECIGFGALFFEGEAGREGAAAWQYV